jgi:hypothetical protein
MLVSKATASAITGEIESAVNAILAKHGMDAGKTMVKYGNLYSIKIEATPLAENENGVNVNSPEAQAWEMFGTSYGFDNPTEALGKTFTTSGKTFKFIGFNTKAPKMPVNAVCLEDGKSYKFPTKALRKIEGFDQAKAIHAF